MQNKEAEKAFFNEFAASQEYDVFDERGYRRLLKEFSLRVKPLRNENFLDIGCGRGAFTVGDVETLPFQAAIQTLFF
jgi:ubiquinone/menaquinone biosynthesis C-methylase UbiE